MSRELSLEEIRLVLALSERIVCGIEQTFDTTGERKKQLALLVLVDILQENGFQPNSTLLELAIESSVLLLHRFKWGPHHAQ